MPLPDLPQTEAAILQQTNAFRAENKLGALTHNAILAKAAKAYAAYLAKSGKFSHTADGREPIDRAKAASYKPCMVGENLALNQSSAGFTTRDLAERAVTGWKNSPPHRAMMLSPSATEIGVGIVQGPETDPKFISVQLYGRPESLQVTLSIENRAGTAVPFTIDDRRRSVAANSRVTIDTCTSPTLTIDGRTWSVTDGNVFHLKASTNGRVDVRLER